MRHLRFRMPRAIRLRATLGAVAVMGVSLAVVSAALLIGLRASQVDRVRSAAATRAEDLAMTIKADTAVESIPLTDTEDRFAQIVAVRTDEVVASSPNVAGRPRLDDPGRLPGDPDDHFVIVTVDVDGFVVVVGREIDTALETVGPLAVLLSVAIPLLLGIVGITTWRVVRGALDPVDAIRREADEIGAGDIGRRVPEPDTGDEISSLAETVNRMLDRLEHSVRQQRQFVADASHELRSPVAAIRQLTEVALAHPERTSLRSLAEEVHGEDIRVQRLVEDLLLLARADEQTLELVRREVDLDDLALDDARRVRQSTDHRIDTAGIGPVRVLGDEFGLGRAVRNLSDNAIRYANTRVAYSVVEEAHRGVIRIDDDGPGIPLSNRERVFDRFVRLDGARSRDEGGAGLGLAIAREIVERHGGQVALSESPLGGLRAEIQLPLASSQADSSSLNG